MIGLYACTGITLSMLAAWPLLGRIGARRLARTELELQALYGQIVSELRASAR